MCTEQQTACGDVRERVREDLLKHTLVLASAPITRVIGLMLSVLGMKRRRDMTVDLGREAT